MCLSVVLSYFVENNEALCTQMKEGGGPKETLKGHVYFAIMYLTKPI